MKENAKILICYNAPVSIFKFYNGKPGDEAAKANDLSENNFLKDLKNIENLLSEYFSEVKSLAVDRDVLKTINNITSIDKINGRRGLNLILNFFNALPI